MARRTAIIAATLAGAVAPVFIRAPRPARAARHEAGRLDEVMRRCNDSGLEGRALVEYAQQLVHRRFVTYTILNVWETPERAFINGRGYANHYNSALATVLGELGFTVSRVRASRVRKDQNPWWRMGHMWLSVVIDGRPTDVCASRASNRPGEVDFVPVSEVHRFNTLTYLNSNNGMIPFAAYEAWKSLLTRQPLPRWVQRPFGERVHEA